MRKLIVAVIVAVLGSTFAQAKDTDKRSLAEEIHDYVLKLVPQYRTIHQTKAMAVCIEWDSPTPPPIKIHNVFITHTDSGSDLPIFTPKLRRDAVRRCKGWAARENANCECHVLDENGKNVLRLP